MCEDVWKMKRATIVIMIFVLMASMLQTLTACLGWPVEQGRTTTGMGSCEVPPRVGYSFFVKSRVIINATPAIPGGEI